MPSPVERTSDYYAAEAVHFMAHTNLGLEEVAERLGISVDYLERVLRRMGLPHVTKRLRRRTRAASGTGVRRGALTG